MKPHGGKSQTTRRPFPQRGRRRRPLHNQSSLAPALRQVQLCTQTAQLFSYPVPTDQFNRCKEHLPKTHNPGKASCHYLTVLFLSCMRSTFAHSTPEPSLHTRECRCVYLHRNRACARRHSVLQHPYAIGCHVLLCAATFSCRCTPPTPLLPRTQ